MAGATIMSVGYGLDVETQNDPYITTAERSVHHLFEAAVPGAFLVDSIPSLKKVPEWIPGAGFKKKAREWRVLSQKMVTLPFKAAKSNIVSISVIRTGVEFKPHGYVQAKGITTPSFVLYSMRAIDENGNKAQQEEDIQSVAGTIYTGTLPLILLFSHFPITHRSWVGHGTPGISTISHSNFIRIPKLDCLGYPVVHTCNVD